MSATKAFSKLLETMDRLRLDCPWDKVQTHQSLSQYLVEEVYEVLDAIENEAWQELRDELGDVLLHIVFQAKIAAEEKNFDIEDVIKHINEKLIRRHPHVFAGKALAPGEDIEELWEEIKRDKEGKMSYIDGVPKAMPSLLRAGNIQRKAAATGFDWQNAKEVLPKLDEEINEFKEAVASRDSERIDEEMGDILFTLVNLSRHVNVNAELSLAKAINKFEKRFRKLEKMSQLEKKEIKEIGIDGLDQMWDKIKAGDQ